jgi:AcrR family transcriptional regulator
MSSRPRTLPPEERRDQLLQVAERMFLKQGVAPTTVEQITQAAGVAKGTFYLYFKSKEDVLAALEGRFERRHLAALATAMAKAAAASWRDRLGVWIRANIAFYLDSIRLHDLLFFGTRPASREGLVDNVVIDHLEAFLKEEIAEDARFTAVFLFSAIHAAVDDAYSREKTVNRKRLAANIERLCLATLGL